MDRCMVLGCSAHVSREGFKLCLPHWRAQREGSLAECEKCRKLREATAGPCPACGPAHRDDREPSDGWLSSTKIGEQLGISSQKVNLVLSELGWIERYVKGWIPTAQGLARGAVKREVRQTGVPYVVWPRSVVENRILADTVRELSGAAVEAKPEPSPGPSAPSMDPGMDFRTRYPATQRTADGHLVRSRAELLIDNWLYTQGIVHAYERRLPIEEDVYCDFYLPGKRVYVEFWGMEKDPKYAERKAKKVAVYVKQGFNLVELTDDDIANLDEALPRKLLKFEIRCD